MNPQPVEKMVPPPRLERGTYRSTIQKCSNEIMGGLRHALAVSAEIRIGDDEC